MRRRRCIAVLAGVVFASGCAASSAGAQRAFTVVSGADAPKLGTARVSAGSIATRTSVDPTGISVLPGGDLLIADPRGSRVLRLDADGRLTQVAGTGQAGFGGDGQSATGALLSRPTAAEALPDGGFLIADIGNQRIRLVTSGGLIGTVAGNGAVGFSGDGGPATAAQLHMQIVYGLAPWRGGFAFPDDTNGRIRYVDARGNISTMVGGRGGTGPMQGDRGPAVDAGLANPSAVHVDGDGLLIADTLDQRIRRISANGTIGTVAGIDNMFQEQSGRGTCCFSGDGGPATAASLRKPSNMAPAGASLLISDEGNHRVRLVDGGGIIHTIYDLGASDDGVFDIEPVDGGVLVSQSGRVTFLQIGPTSRLATGVIGTIALRRGGRHVIRYQLTRRARVRIDVRTTSGRLVGRFRRSGSAGRNELAWSGRRRNTHTTIPAGRYTVSIVARVGKRIATTRQRLTFRGS